MAGYSTYRIELDNPYMLGSVPINAYNPNEIYGAPSAPSSAGFGSNAGGPNFMGNASQQPLANFGGQISNFGSSAGQQTPNFGGNTSQAGSFSGAVPPSMSNPGAYGSYGYNYGFVPNNAYNPYNPPPSSV